MTRRAIVLPLLLALGCTESSLQYGRELFSDPSVSSAGSNQFRCSTCHATTADEPRQFSGYTLYDVVARPNFWGGNETNLFDSINQCVTNFMRGTALLPTDESARALHVYLESISPDASSPALPLTIVKDIVDVPSGDPALGKQVYDRACRTCHGAPHTGAGRIESQASLVPDDSLKAHGTDPKTGARPVVIEKVRHGKFFSVGGNMPLYALERLSDAELGQVLGYLEMFGLPHSAP
jgi:thiosulfate dehydrogenase